MKKIVPLIIGVDGLIGHALWRQFQIEFPGTLGTSRKGTDGLPYQDLFSPDLKQLPLDSFTHAIIAAASPNIRTCELQPESTKLCNVWGTLETAKELLKRGIRPVLFSTDYVFDGTQGNYIETSPPNPTNQYGKQKLELEQKIQALSSGNFLLLRLAKVFPNHIEPTGFFGEITTALRQNKKLKAAEDLLFSPIMLQDVVRGISLLLRNNRTGIYHIGGSEVWTRYDLSVYIANQTRLPSRFIEKISIDSLKEPFIRPKNTSLLSEKLVADTGLQRTRVSDVIAKLSVISK